MHAFVSTPALPDLRVVDGGTVGPRSQRIGCSTAELRGLARALEKCWSADTGWIDDCDRANPARGQCGVTALVVHDRFGGSLVRGLVDEQAPTPTLHYWNLVAGRRVDLTWQQFPGTARVVAAHCVERTDLLANPWLVDRYERLRDRLDDAHRSVRG